MPTYKLLSDGTWIDKETGLPQEMSSNLHEILENGKFPGARTKFASDYYKKFIGEIDDHNASVSRSHDADAMADIEKGVIELVQSGHLDRISAENT